MGGGGPGSSFAARGPGFGISVKGPLLLPVITITGNSELNEINELRIFGGLGGRSIDKLYQEPGSGIPGARYAARGPGSGEYLLGVAVPVPGRAARGLV